MSIMLSVPLALLAALPAETSAAADTAVLADAGSAESALGANDFSAPQDAFSLAKRSESGESQVLDASELQNQRGGQTLVVGNQTLNAVSSGNVLNGDYSAGAISFSDNAFANFNGLGNVAINTGAQVSLQSGMNVIINITQ